ncbi:MAG: hypothetical protein IIX39_03215 [Clostridia bacterium]|nr:hypothetical protein [Clostridia bacterium]
MKKLISVLLVIAMMMSTCVVIFSGTVTAFAATANNAPDTQSITEVVKTFILLVKSLHKYFQEQGGFFALVMDGIYQSLEDVGLDIDGIYEWITTSGIEVWVAEVLFPLLTK